MTLPSPIESAPEDPPYIYDGRLRRGAKRRAAVLVRAVEVASTQGLEGLTFGRLAAELGLSKGHLALLFSSKQTLQLATLDAAMGRFAEEVVAQAARARAPHERLRRLCAAWFRYVSRRVFPGGCFLYATASEYRARRGPIRDRVRQHRAAWDRQLAGAIREGQRVGRIHKSVDAADLVVELTSYQAGANLAALLGDREAFRRAERATRERISRACRFPTRDSARYFVRLGRRGVASHAAK